MTIAMAPVNRKLRAQQTRERIADAAARLFAARGYQGTPMDAIATDAGVAVQTVYYAFRTKPELLIAAYDQAVKGTLDAPPPDQQDWHLHALEAVEEQAGEALRRFVNGVTDILGRTASLVPVMVSSPDEEVRRSFDDRRRWRYEGYQQLVHALAHHGKLRRGLGERKATDVLYSVLSPDLHALFCGFCGWSTTDFERWALDTLQTQLLEPPTNLPSRKTESTSSRRRRP